MAAKVSLEIATPDRIFFQGDIEMVIIKTPQGDMGILPGHVPMVVAVNVGPIMIKKDGEWLEAALSEGFIEIKQHKLVLLTDSAEWPNEIDENRAKAAKQRAEERLQKQLSQIEYVQSRAALARAMARLKVKHDVKKI
jgi:F-type H+-transporting ATPase subunit epsilon